MTLWTWLDAEPSTVAPHVFGAVRKDLHDALAEYDADLPVLVGPLTDIAAALAISNDRVLHDAAALLVPLALSWPRRPVHGDAHTGNVLMTAGGPRWTDFEDVCAGPVEWDLASRTLDDSHVDAYPARIDRDRLEQCRDLRRLQILVGILTDDLQDPDLYGEMIGTAPDSTDLPGRTGPDGPWAAGVGPSRLGPNPTPDPTLAPGGTTCLLVCCRSPSSSPLPQSVPRRPPPRPPAVRPASPR